MSPRPSSADGCCMRMIILDAHNRALRELGAIVDAVPLARFVDPTPCSESNVGQLLAHILTVGLMATPSTRRSH